MDTTPSKRSSTTSNFRGRLINSTWHCDCNPRLPAAYFQTKKEGPNQGRWFYTCPKPRGKEGIRRCEFFLWQDEAGARAEAQGGKMGYVNGDGDMGVPRTPSKRRTSDYLGKTWSAWREAGLMTPQTGTGRKRSWGFEEDGVGGGSETPSKGRRVSMGSGLFDTESEDDLFSLRDDLNSEMDSRSIKQELPDERRSSRSLTLFSQPAPAKPSQPPAATTPRRQISPLSRHAPYPATPTPTRFSTTPLTTLRDSGPPSSLSHVQCPLVSQTLALLDSHHIALPPKARDDLISLLNTHDLRIKGIIRGRDISRLAIQNKEERIQELQGRIDTLESEREAWRAAGMRDNNGMKQEQD